MSEANPELKTRAEIAALFKISEKTLRRHLPSIEGLSCIKLGRTIYFTKKDIEHIERALRCRYPFVNAEKYGMSVGQSALATRSLKSLKNPQDAARKLMQKRLGKH